MMMMSLTPQGYTTDGTPIFTGYVSAGYSSPSQPEPWQESYHADDDDGIDPEEPQSRSVLNGVLGHVLHKIKQTETAWQTTWQTDTTTTEDTTATAKGYKDFLKDYVVNGIGWEAPKEDKIAYANRAITVDLPKVMAADTEDKQFSANTKALLGSIGRDITISTAAVALPAQIQTPAVVREGATPHSNPQYGGQIEAQVGNPMKKTPVQPFVAPKVYPRYVLRQQLFSEQTGGVLSAEMSRLLYQRYTRTPEPDIRKQPVRIADSGEVWSDAQGGYPVDSGANNTKTMLLASADTQQGRLNVATTVKENSYTSRKADAQLLPKYKNDKTQFPTSPTNKAPNITARYDEYIRASIAMYEELRKRYGAEALMHFGTGKVLDLKGQYGLPKAGQYAVVHGRIVTDAWIANAQFGEVMSSIYAKHPEDVGKYAKKIITTTKSDAPYIKALKFISPYLDSDLVNSTLYVGTTIPMIENAVTQVSAHAYSYRSRGGQWDQPEDQAAIVWGLELARQRFNRQQQKH